MCICASVLAPACVSPSAAAAGFAVHSFPHMSQSVMIPPPNPPSSAVLGLTLLHFCTTLARTTFVLFFASIPRSAYTGIFTSTYFQGEIMPRNALAHVHFPSGPLT